MRNLIHGISNVLNMIKGFDTGHTTSVNDKMIIDYEGQRYIVSFEKIEDKNSDMFKDIEQYL
jgi:hypothetical protein